VVAGVLVPKPRRPLDVRRQAHRVGDHSLALVLLVTVTADFGLGVLAASGLTGPLVVPADRCPCLLQRGLGDLGRRRRPVGGRRDDRRADDGWAIATCRPVR